jgi:tripartite-type tricarboxylate transporter receptor subunit TctC
MKKVQRRQFLQLVAGAAALPATSNIASAQAYPSRPVRLVIGYTPGGSADLTARLMGQWLSEKLGQSFVIENRPGGGTNIATEQVLRATPDGYTLLLTSTAIAVNPALFNNLGYDPFKDFAPVSELVNAPNVIVVRPDSGITAIGDLVARAKAQPNTFNYASPGVGTKSHLSAEELKLRAGIQMTHVPYRGAGPAALAVLEGTTQVGSVALAAAESMIKSGQLRALAVTGAKRWFSLPEVPTMIESGFPGFVSDTFNAMFAPAGTPAPIVATLVKESQASLRSPEALEQAHRAGFEVVAGTPEQLSARLAAEIPAVKALVARIGIKPE